MHRKNWFLLAILILLLAACAPENNPEPEPTAAPVVVKLTTQPETVQAGEVDLIFAVMDAAGQPLSAADVDVIADHTEMGGMTIHGKAIEQDSGRYSIGFYFSMAGQWEITVQVRKGDINYREEIDFPVK